MNSDLPYWLALARMPGIGPRTARPLVNLAGGVAAVFEPEVRKALRGQVAPETLRCLADPPWRQVEDDLRWVEQPDNSALTMAEPDYPALLAQIADPPLVLFVCGRLDALSVPQLAVVGSRNPTPGGRQTAHDFAVALAAAGLTVTSGLALGIDAAGHEGALAAGGRTVAVSGCGLDRVYPSRHRDLAHRIAAHGALISEFPPGAPPLPEHFPRRNRIISGLSLGTLVIEAALRSGSLITARLAADQGREVFAVPGSIHSPLSRGCHALIRQGAKLVETAADVLEELNGTVFAQMGAGDLVGLRDREGIVSGIAVSLEPEHEQLLSCLAYEPASVDQLVERSGLTPEVVSSMLLIMELEGYVTCSAGGRYCRTTKRA